MMMMMMMMMMGMGQLRNQGWETSSHKYSKGWYTIFLHVFSLKLLDKKWEIVDLTPGRQFHCPCPARKASSACPPRFSSIQDGSSYVLPNCVMSIYLQPTTNIYISCVWAHRSVYVCMHARTYQYLKILIQRFQKHFKSSFHFPRSKVKKHEKNIWSKSSKPIA